MISPCPVHRQLRAKLEAQVSSVFAEEKDMAVQTTKIEITATLKSVSKFGTAKYIFKVEDRSNGGLYHFLLTKEKALKLANADSEFPSGVNLRLSGRISRNVQNTLNFVKVHAVDGHDVQAWAERNSSPTVNPEVVAKAQTRINEAEEEAMRRRAPPDPPPAFKSPGEAFEKAMYLLVRQVRLKDSKLTMTEIYVIRDALNMLKERAGL